MRWACAGLLAAGIGSSGPFSSADSMQHNAPVNVIFDTDMWSDIDDALALAMLHALQDRHEINLVAVTVSTGIKWCASYVDLIDTFYNHPQVPVGLDHHGLKLDAFRARYPKIAWPVTRYTESLAKEKNSDGHMLYPHRLVDGSKAEEAVPLLRKTLATQPDAHVVIVETGYLGNLSRLLDSGPDAASPLDGIELVRTKVRLLALMGGNFADSNVGGRFLAKGSPEFNLAMDVAAAQKVFSRWPTSIVDSGFEVGLAMSYPAASIERDFSYVAHHPIAETYRTYARETGSPWPHDHPTFDLTAVLYAARPTGGYFSLSKPGRISVLPDGGSRFDDAQDGLHRYLILNDAQKARALEAMVMLVSQRAKDP